MNAQIPSSEGFKAATREQWNRSAQGWSSESPKIRSWRRSLVEDRIRRAPRAARALLTYSALSENESRGFC
jgi:hypothetical protein